MRKVKDLEVKFCLTVWADDVDNVDDKIAELKVHIQKTIDALMNSDKVNEVDLDIERDVSEYEVD